MSLLNLRKNKKEDATAKKLVVTGDASKVPVQTSPFITRLRVSEKATMLAGAQCYTLDVARTANKYQIAEAVEAQYRVTPEYVRVLPIPTKRLFSRGKVGKTGGGKKAYVFLKKGDKIDIA